MYYSSLDLGPNKQIYSKTKKILCFQMCRKIKTKAIVTRYYIWEFKHAHIQLTAKQNNLERLHLHITAIYRLSNFWHIRPRTCPSPRKDWSGQNWRENEWVLQLSKTPFSTSFLLSALHFSGNTPCVQSPHWCTSPPKAMEKFLFSRTKPHPLCVHTQISPTYKRVTFWWDINWKYS